MSASVKTGAERGTVELPPFADLQSVTDVEALGLDRFAPEASIFELLAGSARRDPERRAFWHIESGASGARESHLTYASLLKRVIATANLFFGLGIRRDDVVAYMLPSVPEVHELIWGGATAAIACPVNYFLEPELLVAMLRTVKARALVVAGADVHAEIWSKVELIRRQLPELREIVRVGGAANDFGLDYRREVTLARADGLRMPAPSGDDVAAYFHTGGTTGAPKFARQTHRNQVVASRSAAYAFGLRPVDVVLSGLPHFHVGGLYAGGLVPLSAGATVVQLGTMGFRDPTITPNFWRIAEMTRATVPVVIPTIVSALLETDHSVCATRRIRFMISGAAGLAPGLRAAFESRTGVRINEAYGLTEATFVVSVNPWAGIAKPGSTGIRLPFVEVRAQPSDESAAASIQVRGPTVFAGYLGLAADSQPVQDGWLDTGDLGRIDEQGHVHLTGRSKDLIKRGGHGIDPSLIEEPLSRHAAVALCAAVGQPDARVGELPVAYVELRAGATVTQAELLDFAQREIRERAAVPKAIYIHERLPKTAVGKIDKLALRRDATRIAVLHVIAAALPEAAAEQISLDFVGDKLVVRLHGVDAASIALVRERLRDFSFAMEIIDS